MLLVTVVVGMGGGGGGGERGEEGGGGEGGRRGRRGGVPVPESAVLGAGEEMVGMVSVELDLPYCGTEQRQRDKTV